MKPARALEKLTAVFCWVTSLCLSVEFAAATADNSPQLPTTNAPLVAEQLGESPAVFVENNRQRADWRNQVAGAGAEYQGDGLAVTMTDTGARLHCVFQRLEGEATPEGLWLTSTVPGQPNDRFRVIAVEVGRSVDFGVRRQSAAATPLFPHEVLAEPPVASESGVALRFPPQSKILPATGTVEVADNLVRFMRPGLVEEYTVSMDGVRQDFVVLEKPPLTPSLSPSDGERVASRPGEGKLRLELAVTGARVEPIAGGVHPERYAGQAVDHERGSMLSHGARLVLEKSGRKIAYSRLRVTDATGKELAARMEVAGKSEIQNPKSEIGLAVLVDDAQAVYPIRIDPTFSDANWISMGGIPGANREVFAAVVDSSGNLYIGGNFTLLGNVDANRVAKWNGSSWSALGSGMNGAVNALAVSGSDLYAGGGFATAGGSPAYFIAKWNGSTWSALGTGMNNYVEALVVSGGDLYVGGQFTTAGGNPANYIAKWNGSSWSALGSGMNDWVYALVVLGSDLYAGGGFTMADGVSANRIAKWNGSSWSALGSGMGSTVYALAVSGSNLYAGGGFTIAGGNAASRVSKWDGSVWSALGSGMNHAVLALAVSGSDLYAGGQFTTAGGTAARQIAKWSGNSWSGLGSGVNNVVRALAVSGNDLYAGGFFSTAGGKVSPYIARAVLGDAPGYNQLTGTLLSEGAMQFSYIGYPATNYALDRAFNLSPPVNWVGQETNTMTVSGVLSFTNTPVPGTNNFWRVRSVP